MLFTILATAVMAVVGAQGGVDAGTTQADFSTELERFKSEPSTGVDFLALVPEPGSTDPNERRVVFFGAETENSECRAFPDSGFEVRCLVQYRDGNSANVQPVIISCRLMDELS